MALNAHNSRWARGVTNGTLIEAMLLGCSRYRRSATYSDLQSLFSEATSVLDNPTT